MYASDDDSDVEVTRTSTAKGGRRSRRVADDDDEADLELAEMRARHAAGQIEVDALAAEEEAERERAEELAKQASTMGKFIQGPNSSGGKRTRMVPREETYVDDEGYFVTKTEMVEVTDDEAETVAPAAKPIPTASPAAAPAPAAKKAEKPAKKTEKKADKAKDEAKDQKKEEKRPGNILNFFGKKSK
jgi:outer membrane biosynthesis protein TonB